MTPSNSPFVKSTHLTPFAALESDMTKAAFAQSVQDGVWNNAVKPIGKAFGRAGQGLLGTIGGALGTAWEGATAVPRAIGNAFAGGMQRMGENNGINPADFAQGAWDKGTESLAGSASRGWGSLKRTAGGAADYTTGMLEGVGRTAAAPFTGAYGLWEGADNYLKSQAPKAFEFPGQRTQQGVPPMIARPQTQMSPPWMRNKPMQPAFPMPNQGSGSAQMFGSFEQQQNPMFNILAGNGSTPEQQQSPQITPGGNNIGMAQPLPISSGGNIGMAQPASAQQTDWNSRFRRDTGTAFDPNSRMDAYNMSRMQMGQPTMDYNQWRQMQKSGAINLFATLGKEAGLVEGIAKLLKRTGGALRRSGASASQTAHAVESGTAKGVKATSTEAMRNVTPSTTGSALSIPEGSKLKTLKAPGSNRVNVGGAMKRTGNAMEEWAAASPGKAGLINYGVPAAAAGGIGFGTGNSMGRSSGLSEGFDAGSEAGVNTTLANMPQDPGVLGRLMNVFSGNPAGPDGESIRAYLDQNKHELLRTILQG